MGALTFRLGGLYFAIATLSFAELMRLTWVNLIYQIEVDGFLVGPKGAEGFRDIRFVIDQRNLAGWLPRDHRVVPLSRFSCSSSCWSARGSAWRSE